MLSVLVAASPHANDQPAFTVLALCFLPISVWLVVRPLAAYRLLGALTPGYRRDLDAGRVNPLFRGIFWMFFLLNVVGVVAGVADLMT